MSPAAFQEPGSHPRASKPGTGGTSVLPHKGFALHLCPVGFFPHLMIQLSSHSCHKHISQPRLYNSLALRQENHTAPTVGTEHTQGWSHLPVVSKPLCLLTASVAPLRHLSPGSGQDLSSYITPVPGSFSQIHCSATHQPSNQIKAGDLLFQSISPLN